MNRKTIQLFLAAATAASAGSLTLFAEGEICHKCAIIREENKTKNFNDGFVYYEDYLKKHPEAHGSATTQDNESKETQKNDR